LATRESKEFDEFVKRQQEPGRVSVDWNRERDDWLAQLSHLYKDIEAFLKDYVRSGQIRFEYQKVKLNEEHIGAYEATQLVLRNGQARGSPGTGRDTPDRRERTC
jgi:hypothetical protein